MKKFLNRISPSGFVVSGPGMGGETGEIIEVPFAGMVGALLGFVFGMLCGVLARIFTLNRVKGIIGGRHWAAYGAGAGGLALSVIEMLD